MLEMRNRQLEEVQQRFAIQQHRVVEVERLLNETHQQIREHMQVRDETLVDPVLSQQRFAYIQYLKTQAQHLHEALKQEENQLSLIREEMRQAHIRKRSLEMLEEKQRKAYLKLLATQEEKELEDLVIARRHPR